METLDQTAPLDDPLIGRVIAGKMRLDAVLGEGAMGRVYRAYHAGLDKTVAIKVLHPEAVAAPTIAVRFQSEARTASRLDHPNSLRILDFGVDGDDRLLYIAMEFLEGRTFRSLLQDCGRLPPKRAAWIVGQVCSALAAAHDEGVIHRDVKPDNIILSTRQGDHGPIEDFVKVCDFGLAKALDAPAESPTGGPLTQHGTVLGTPAYMSPEQAKGERVDHRSDLYACGVMLYRALCGSNPFSGDSAWAVSLKQISDLPPPLLERAPDVDPALAALVHRALEKDPDDRFQSARELKQALEEIVGVPELASGDSVWQSSPLIESGLAPTFISHPSSQRSPPSRRPTIATWIAIAGAFGLVLVLAIAMLTKRDEPPLLIEPLPSAPSVAAPPPPEAVEPVVAPVVESQTPPPKPRARRPRPAKLGSERGHDRNALEDPF